jgi:hypothetical protein
MLRPELARYAAWEREAKRRGLAVSALAMQLIDEASGWRGEGGPRGAPCCGNFSGISGVSASRCSLLPMATVVFSC